MQSNAFNVNSRIHEFAICFESADSITDFVNSTPGNSWLYDKVSSLAVLIEL